MKESSSIVASAGIPFPSGNPVASRALSVLEFSFGAFIAIDSGIAGLILGTAYMLAGLNLWARIFANGFIDTFGIIDAFFGWST